MALVVLHRFANLMEAHAAAAALRAAGLNPSVFDEGTGSVLPVHQLFLAGYRVVVPEEEALLAAEVLTVGSEAGPGPEATGAVDAHDAEYEPPAARPRWTGWWTALGVLMFLTGPPAGFALVLARRNPTPFRIGVLAVFVLITVLFWTIVFTSGSSEAGRPVVLTPQYAPTAPPAD